MSDAIRGEPFGSAQDRLFGKLKTGLSNPERHLDRLRANGRKPVFKVKENYGRQEEIERGQEEGAKVNS